MLMAFHVLRSVAGDGVVDDWPSLQKMLVDRLRPPSDLSPSGDLSPASTVRLDDAASGGEFLIRWLASLETPPLSVQRLCEFLVANETINLDNPKVCASLERILAPTHYVRPGSNVLLHRRTSRGSLYSNSSVFTPDRKRGRVV